MDDFIISLSGISIVVPGYALQLLVAAFLGMLLGVERAMRQKAASVRTFALICAGSCLYAVLSKEAAGAVGQGPYDVTRVAAGIVTGIGFIGGGVIFKTSDRIEGITTASMIWMAAGIGMACGFNHIGVAIWGVAVYWFVLMFGGFFHRIVETRLDRDDYEEAETE